MEQKTATSVAAAVRDMPSYSGEVRFGVVMYGGVSLAIYINGVANELYEMVCATPRDGFRLPASGDGPGTREIYSRVALLAGNEELRKDYVRRIRAEAEERKRTPAAADGKPGTGSAPPRDVWQQISGQTAKYQQTRFVVDVIAGTSAGGINGVFLAKALANGEQFGALKDLWVNEGDIGLLLNDQRSYQTTEPSIADRSNKPTSLLNSDRMYMKLLNAMKAMEPLRIERSNRSEASAAPDSSPLVEEVDLFVTTTDIVGARVPLRLFDKVVHELRHKQSYRFRYPDGVTKGGNDFVATNNPFLAFASRCTSSFPFAFEPMTLAAVARLTRSRDLRMAGWDAFFPNLPRGEVAAGEHVDRAFGDGGYLDNKPFTYVVETLSNRFSSVPLERKLVYVEPSPETLDADEKPDPENPPDALTNSIAALTRIPQYETIREDLQAVLQRNRRIERVERIVRSGDADIDRYEDPFATVLREEGRTPQWSSLTLSRMIGFYGLAYLPYQRLRVFAVTDTLADQLAERWGIDHDSDHLYALRALVRVWRETHFHDEGEKGRETINAFLDQFDIDYRLRRLGFVLRKTDQLTRLFYRRSQGPIKDARGGDDVPPALSESDLQLSDKLPKSLSPLSEDLDQATINAALKALRALKAGLLDIHGALLHAKRDLRQVSDAERAQYAGLRGQLDAVLGIVLGARPKDAPALVLALRDGGETPVVLDAKWQRVASASRTLQESVFLRAKALLKAAERSKSTALQDALESSLTPMRVKRSDRRPDDEDPLLNRISARVWALLGGPALALVERLPQKPDVIVQVGDATCNSGDASKDATLAAALNTSTGKVLREFLGEYYLRFDSYDQISFPLYYDTGTGEPSTVEVARISPRDATSLIDEASDRRGSKLAGTAFAHFGAFLEREWRRNDIMWGRLDGAERLIQVLLPMSDDETEEVRRELIRLAHGRILRETLMAGGRKDLTDILCNALQEMPSSEANVEKRLGDLLKELNLGDAAQRTLLQGVLSSLLSEQGLIDYVRERREIDRKPNPKATLDNAARAVTITGRVLEGISKKAGKATAQARWVARLGLLLQGIVAVSLPGTLRHRWWTHIVKVVYAFEAVALLFALLIGGADARSLVFTAIGVTIGVHLLTLIAGDLARARALWLWIVLGAVIAVLLGLAAVGAFVLWTVPL